MTNQISVFFPAEWATRILTSYIRIKGNAIMIILIGSGGVRSAAIKNIAMIAYFRYFAIHAWYLMLIFADIKENNGSSKNN